MDISETQLALSQRVEKLYVYASMKNDQDTREGNTRNFKPRLLPSIPNFLRFSPFMSLAPLAITDEQLAAFYEEEPALKLVCSSWKNSWPPVITSFLRNWKRFWQQPAKSLRWPFETFSILDNASLRFPEIADEDGRLVPLSHGNYISFMESQNREVRQEAYEAMYSTYEQFQHTYAKTLQSNVKVNNLQARLRHYKSARHAALSKNFVPESVYESLVSAVNKHLPLLHRYIQLRKQLLGIEDLKMYDMYTPLSSTDYKFTYEEALKK